jgi:hypothetical protein
MPVLGPLMLAHWLRSNLCVSRRHPILYALLPIPVTSFNRTGLYFVIFAAFACGAAGTWAVNHDFSEQPPSGPPLIAFEKMGRLVSVKLNYSNVIEFLQPRTMGIPWTFWNVSLGGTTVLLVAKGDGTVATDLTKAQYSNVRNSERTVTLVLPVPTPLQARVNHDPRVKGGSYFYAVTQHGAQAILPGLKQGTTAMNGALQRAQNEIEQACKQPSVIATAKENAEAVLGGMLQATGWKAQVVWK